MSAPGPSTTPRAQGVLAAHAAHRPADDPIFALHAEAVRRAAAGEDVVNATLGALLDDEGRLGLLPVVDEVYRRIPVERSAGYAPISGSPAFLDAVIRDLVGEGELAARAVGVATAGGTGAVHHAIQNFLAPGDAILTPDHFWGPYRAIAEHAGRGLDVFPTFGADLRMDLAALEEALERQIARQGRVLLILNDPCNNPTGYSLDDAEWAGLVEVLARAGRQGPIALLLDRAYERFARGGADRWLAHVPALPESVSVLVAWTASKSFAQYGARVGALVALHPDAAERERIAHALNYSCRATWSNCNHHGMLVVQRLLTDPELAERAAEEREVLIDLLDRRVGTFNRLSTAAGLVHPRYEGGFFVAVLTPDSERTAEVMRERGVFVVPIRAAVRVALCAIPTDRVARVVDALAEGVSTAGRELPRPGPSPRRMEVGR